MSDSDRPPVRVCCGKRHFGIVCPDGKVMCCMCFERFDQDQLSIDPKDGKKLNICKECDDKKKRRRSFEINVTHRK